MIGPWTVRSKGMCIFFMSSVHHHWAKMKLCEFVWLLGNHMVLLRSPSIVGLFNRNTRCQKQIWKFCQFLVKCFLHSSVLSKSIHIIKYKVISMGHNWNYPEGSSYCASHARTVMILVYWFNFHTYPYIGRENYCMA